MTTNRLQIPEHTSLVHRLEIKPIFDSLSSRHKLYAHYLPKSAWAGTRIILPQTSGSSETIFEFIISLYRACDGKWDFLADECAVTDTEVQAFLSYAALFLYNLGQFYGDGGQQFVPDLSNDSLKNTL
ncbi:hypothetical protein G6011_08546 [Alternaria panax]|uniref:Uncharacterized protein n=1 Tax=Alternaria panax TaxID=48097 RepID=A0AAD4FK71_9PLEO|nr:hypothetical protein G6011_08546 [Alternaria panax]